MKIAVLLLLSGCAAPVATQTWLPPATADSGGAPAPTEDAVAPWWPAEAAADPPEATTRPLVPDAGPDVDAHALTLPDAAPDVVDEPQPIGCATGGHFYVGCSQSFGVESCAMACTPPGTCAVLVVQLDGTQSVLVGMCE
jgi:hypothetical protein